MECSVVDSGGSIGCDEAFNMFVAAAFQHFFVRKGVCRASIRHVVQRCAWSILTHLLFHHLLLHKYFFAAVATLCLNTGLTTLSPFPTGKNGFIIVFNHASYTSTMKFFTASSVAGAAGL